MDAPSPSCRLAAAASPVVTPLEQATRAEVPPLHAGALRGSREGHIRGDNKMTLTQAADVPSYAHIPLPSISHDFRPSSALFSIPSPSPLVPRSLRLYFPLSRQFFPPIAYQHPRIPLSVHLPQCAPVALTAHSNIPAHWNERARSLKIALCGRALPVGQANTDRGQQQRACIVSSSGQTTSG
eukprot:GHVU01176208.1.p1 GENE.GHVU01176208.1~~GHVU01176208.1.p1  ORF type:complete len:183 (+),score=10.76 GHVU01176208.1:265-813(+)